MSNSIEFARGAIISYLVLNRWIDQQSSNTGFIINLQFIGNEWRVWNDNSIRISHDLLRELSINGLLEKWLAYHQSAIHQKWQNNYRISSPTEVFTLLRIALVSIQLEKGNWLECVFFNEIFTERAERFRNWRSNKAW